MANAALITTYTTSTAIGQREDLEDAVYNISPEETPVLSMIGRTPVNAVLHEWQTESLATASTANAQIQGLNYSEFATVTPTVRSGNYSQILTKLVSVSGTLDTVSKAGRGKEIAHQTLKKMKELKRDLAATIMDNIAGAPHTATAATMATMCAWLKTNVSPVTTSEVHPTWVSGAPSAAKTDGSTRAFSEALFKAVLQLCATSGATPTVATFGVVNKGNASKFAGIATKTQVFDTSKASAMPIIGASDIYVSDFGKLSFVYNRFQRDRDAWVLTPDMLAVGFLRPFQTINLAKTGDATNMAVLCEATLIVKTEAAHGCVSSLDVVVQ